MDMALRIKELRKAAGLSQEELGEKLGLGKSAIAKYENGRVQNIKRSTIEKMAELFSCRPSYLMGYDDDESTDYYLDPKTADLANKLKDTAGKRVLMDSAQDLTPEETLEVIDFINSLKHNE